MHTIQKMEWKVKDPSTKAEKPPVVPQHVFLAEHSASGRVLDITAQLLLHDLVARLRCGIAEDVDEGLSKNRGQPREQYPLRDLQNSRIEGST